MHSTTVRSRAGRLLPGRRRGRWLIADWMSGKWFWLFLVGALLLLARATPASAAEPVSLVLEAPQQMAFGEEATVAAVLTDAQGAPVAGATVLFWTPGQFLSTGGAVELGRATTDARGRVAFPYQARSEGAVTLFASFAGDSRHAPVQASAEVPVLGSGQLYQSTAGVRLPGLSVWLLVAALGTAWSIYLGMMVLVTLIARAGGPTPGEVGGTGA